MKGLFLSLLFFFFTASILSGQKTIEGKVSDESGENLIGATIKVKENPLFGTITDDNGRFLLSLPQEATTLIVSYVGYTSLEIKLSNEQSYYPILLTSSATALDEVVVIGYGTQLRSQLTSSVAKIKSSDIEDAQVISMESALQGRMAGVVVNSSNGKLGQGIQVNIRGTATINGFNNPLYVVDGVVLTDIGSSFTVFNANINPLADINMNDIESISVLKDAAAAAIYGSAGSNGVVIITTKRGKANESRIDLDISTGFSKPTHKREWLNAAQYLELWEEAFNNVANANGRVFGQTSTQWKDTYIPGWNGGYDTNWEDLAYNDHAGLKEVQLSASGGDDKTKYYLSGSYLDQDGIIIFNKFGRTSGRINLEHRSDKNYDLGINMSLSKSTNDRLPTDGDFVAPSSLNAIPPVQPLRDPDDPEEYYEKTLYLNAYRFLDGGSLWYSKVFSNLGNVYLNWRPIKNLTVHHDFGLDHKTQDDKLWISSRGSLPIFGEPGGYAYSSFRTSSSFTTNHYVTYQQQIKDAVYDVTLGTVFFNYYQHYNRVSGRKFPNDDFRNISNAAETFEGRELENEISSISYFLRTNFNWQQKYLVSFSSRIDGDSRFGPDTRYGFFPAASVGWVISDESFLVENPVFSYLKFRASWGITGNVPPGSYPYQDNFAGDYYAGRPSIVPSRIANPALKWEQTAQYDLGLDFGLWNDRISGQLDVYRKNTRDLLLDVNIPATTGFSTQLQNLGKLKNQGIELSLSAHILTQAFRWTATLNAAMNKNEITDIQGQVIESGTINRAIEGQPIGVFFAVEYAGVDPDNGDPLYYLNNKQDDGSYNRETTNDINLAERVVIGDPNPDLTYGISNSFSFKGIHLDLFFQGQQGNEIYNGGGIYQMDGFGWFDNQDIRILDRWQKPGDITKIPQLRFLEPGVKSSRYLEPGSYLRLKTLTLAYLLPEKLLTPLKLSKLQFYFTAQNLLTVTNYQGWDPEVNADFLEGTISKGIDFYSPPQAKTLVFGIKTGF